jgi:integrase
MIHTAGRSRYVTDTEFEKVRNHAHFTVVDAMDLALLTGQRPADVLKLRCTDIRDGALWIVQNKTGARLGIEVTGELAVVIAMVGRSNLEQLKDLLARVLNSGRADRYGNYWGKSNIKPKRVVNPDEGARAVEVTTDSVPKKLGRPTADSVRPQVPERPKRKYARRSNLVRGAGKHPDPPEQV